MILNQKIQQKNITIKTNYLNINGNDECSDSTIKDASWTIKLQILEEYDSVSIRERRLMGGSSSNQYNTIGT